MGPCGVYGSMGSIGDPLVHGKSIGPWGIHWPMGKCDGEVPCVRTDIGELVHWSLGVNWFMGYPLGLLGM